MRVGLWGCELAFYVMPKFRYLYGAPLSAVLALYKASSSFSRMIRIIGSDITAGPPFHS